MERIKNIYCWDCLRDWNEAQNMGIVRMIEMKQGGESMFGWKQLIHMMYEDCFPQCFLCFRKNNENYLVLTKEQKTIVDFIKNKVLLQEREGTQYLFTDFPAEYRNRILDAHVDSIWIRLDEDENYI